jgi:hypothetical protein
LVRVLAHLTSNVVLGVITLEILRRQGEKHRLAFEASIAERTEQNRQRAAEVMGTAH